MENQDQNQQINVELTEDMADGTYANLAIITHSQTEFVLDFVNLMPGSPKAKVKSRLIMNPFHAKRLMRALIENVKNYESANGVIRDQEQGAGEGQAIPFNVNGPKGEA